MMLRDMLALPLVALAVLALILVGSWLYVDHRPPPQWLTLLRAWRTRRNEAPGVPLSLEPPPSRRGRLIELRPARKP